MQFWVIDKRFDYDTEGVELLFSNDILKIIISFYKIVYGSKSILSSLSASLP